MPTKPLSTQSPSDDELRYNPRNYGKSFKAWQVFIAASKKGEPAVYRTPEGDICSPARVEQLKAQWDRESRIKEHRNLWSVVPSHAEHAGTVRDISDLMVVKLEASTELTSLNKGEQ